MPAGSHDAASYGIDQALSAMIAGVSFANSCWRVLQAAP
jgi:hypothetical protein